MRTSTRRKRGISPKKDEQLSREVRKRNRAEAWLTATRFLRPWILDLVRRYKDRGEYEPMAFWVLPSYYTDPKDIEVAAFASLLIRDGERMQQYVDDFRRMFGDSPFEWLKSRAFVSLGSGANRDKRTGGVSNAKVADYFNVLHVNWWRREDKTYEILAYFFGEEKAIAKERLVRLVLSHADGLGRGVWTITPQNLKCPPTDGLRRFLHQWMPESSTKGRGGAFFTYDEAVGMFGFGHDCDFLYFMMAWHELSRIEPFGCKRLLGAFQKWYREGANKTSKFWMPTTRRGVLLDLDRLHA